MRLYLLPHQDDEFALLKSISDDVAADRAFALLYLTDGAYGGPVSELRNHESLTVLESVGVREEQVHFLGIEYQLRDGFLYSQFKLAWQAILTFTNSLSYIDSVYMPAWEGGHQDHDATHILGLCIANKYACLSESRQVALYHGEGLPSIFFKVLSPLIANGEIIKKGIPWPQRLQFLRLFFCYRSQLKTWLALYPFVLINMLFHGVESLQPVSVQRIYQSPHRGKLLYESRGSCLEQDFRAHAESFLHNNHLLSDEDI
jgi:hypothetical protein